MPFFTNSLGVKQWYPKLFAPKQIAVFNSRARALLVSGPRLSGKCTHRDTLIQCDGRLSRIGSLGRDVDPGDTKEVQHSLVCLDTDSRKLVYSESSSVYHDPTSEGFRILVGSGHSLDCSPWHPVWCLNGGKFSFKTSTEIKSLIQTGEEVWVPLRLGYEGWTELRYQELCFSSTDKKLIRESSIHRLISNNVAKHKGASPTTVGAWSKVGKTNYTTMRSFLKRRTLLPSYKVTLDEDVAYLIGMLVRDGCMTDTVMNSNRVGFASNDQELIDSLKRVLGKHFPGAKVRHGGGCDWHISASQKLFAMIRHVGLNHYAHEKRIPDCVIESPKSVVRSFLQGLFDTDGCGLKNGFVEYCSSSRSLASDVQQLLLAFGVRSALKFRSNSHRGAWHLYVWADAAVFYREVGFRLSRKQARRFGLKRKVSQEPTAYPPSIRAEIKRLYLSRHVRGAPRNNLPRSKKHSGFESLYGGNGSSVSIPKLSQFIDFACAHSDAVMQDYHIGGKVFWEKVKSVEPCKVDLFDFTVPKYHNFVGNGFINHNTIAVLHRIARHLWETPRARVAMFARTIKSSKDGGSWSLLNDVVLREWFEANIGMRYTSSKGRIFGPKTDGLTRTMGFKVSNVHGGESELMLFSLDFDNDVESKLKEMQFSMIYFSELDKFGDRRVLTVALPSLRMEHLTFEQQMWIADTNPSEEGENSWIYKLFLKERLMSYEEFCEYQKRQELPSLEERDFREFYAQLDVIEILPRDNPYVDPRQLQEVRVSCAGDAGLYARHVDGKWVWGGGDASRHFRAIFRRPLHVVGNCESSNEADWLMAEPSPMCFELVTGWDLGDVNHAAVIMESSIRTNRLDFAILDELVSLGKEVSNETFTFAFMELVEKLEKVAGRPLRLDRSWSDRSSIERYSASADTYPHLQVHAASGERIFLRGTPKGRESIKLRVRIVKELLTAGRLKVSAHCVQTISMFENLRKGKSSLDYVIGDERHIFDAISYALMMELKEEYELRPVAGSVGNRSGLAVQVG